MTEKKYWKGLEELHNTPEHQAVVADEFRELLPLADLDDKFLGATAPRRDFLKYLGFSTAAAMLAASCEMPVRKAIPYAIKPEDVTPGVANWYASTFTEGGDYCAIVVKNRDGRPIKIEGNELSSINAGGTSARVQASVLSLYDTARLRGPFADGKRQEMYNGLDKLVAEGLASGKKNYLLTGTILSPTIKEVIAQFIAKYPNTTHVMWDPISFSGMLDANLASYGKRTLPSYQFDRASTIVGLGADFLGTWLSPTEFARQYAAGRKISAKSLRMSKHYQVESLQTNTGACADVRATCRPSEMGAIAVALYTAVTGGTPAKLSSPALDKAIAAAATDLKAAPGLVVCGSNDANVQTVVNAINNAIGANGKTINWAVTANYRQGDDAAMVRLVEDMKGGAVGALLLHGVNPVQEYMEGPVFAAAMKSVPTRVSFSDRMDETASVCNYLTPDHHFLESWGDAEPKSGYFSLMQPAIAPLFKTRGFADSLLIWSGSATNYAQMWTSYWMGKLGSQNAFDRALQDGVIEPGRPAADEMTVYVNAATGATDTVRGMPNNGTSAGQPEGMERDTAPMAMMGGASFAGNIGEATSAIAAMKPAGAVEVVVYEKIGIGRGGCWSNNPWLQELPDPITKATWDNYFVISPGRAKMLDEGKGQDLETTSQNEVDLNKRLLTVKVGGKEITLPAVVIPGVHNDVIGVAVGYGRIKSVGMAAAELGKNAYPFMRWNGRSFVCDSPGSVAKADGRYEVAITQTHHSYEGRAIIREMTLASFAQDPDQVLKAREELVGHFAHLPWQGDDGGHGTGASGGTMAAGDHSTAAPHGANADAMVDPGGHTLAVSGSEASEHSSAAKNSFEEGFRKNGTLYPDYEHAGIHWGMSIDLTSCVGCGACVIGCQSENNISVVGKAKVLKAQEMHWLTIDRYFTGNPDDSDSIQTIFQPMLCQHCDNAPCENVCPVSATNHSSEGLNQMAYNRCIGTKYCANNCPYKVRHFNWMDWNEADCFEDNTYEDYRRDEMNDNLTRMVLNPDVTVRSRGVMEKCSFCVQRLQEGKLAAKKEGRPVRDGEIKTACQQACPTDGIVFGNVNDKESAIYKLRQEQMERTYYVLEELHSLPNVNYLALVRNTDHIEGGSKNDVLMEKHI